MMQAGHSQKICSPCPDNLQLFSKNLELKIEYGFSLFKAYALPDKIIFFRSIDTELNAP